MKSITFLILTTFMSSTSAHDFPSQQVEHHCRVAMHYITYKLDECILQQYQWFEVASQSPDYSKSLWWGQKQNWRGDVVEVDFRLVLDRVEYLK